MNIFKGYIPTNGKVPLYSVKTFTPLPEPPSSGDYGGILDDNIIQVDIDEQVLAEKVFKIISDLKIRCNILRTNRGLHFYFKNTTVKNQSVHFYSAIGIPCDYGLGSKKRIVPLRITQKRVITTYENGIAVEKTKAITTQREWLQTYDELDNLPAFLYPVGNGASHILEIECRNQALFNYILTLQSVNMNKEDIRLVINVINKYVLKTPLDQREIDTICRDEAFKEDLFFTEKGKFLHDIFGNYLLNNSFIINIDGQTNIYTKNGLYTNKPSEFEKIMLDKIPFLKETQRKEVYKYICLKCQNEGRFSDPKYIGLKDSILDLETMELVPYNPSFIIQNRINYNYNANAYSELMDKTLDKVCCDDKQIRALLEEMIGYTLYRANTMQTCFILTGEGSNGKSTILNCIKRLLGKDNYTSLDLRELEDTFKPAELYNKLANLGDDISAKYLDNSSMFKKCVTGESFMVQRKYADPFELESYATQIFCANELPQVSDKSEGFTRRITIVPFNAKFSKYDSDYDPFIESKLLEDSAIEYLLKIAIDGLKRVIINKAFTKSEKGEAEKSEYMRLNNNVLEWLDSEPKIENESVNDVYLQYQVWCNQNGTMPVKKMRLGKEITKNGYISKSKYIDGKTVRIYVREELK